MNGVSNSSGGLLVLTAHVGDTIVWPLQPGFWVSSIVFRCGKQQLHLFGHHQYPGNLYIHFHWNLLFSLWKPRKQLQRWGWGLWFDQLQWHGRGYYRFPLIRPFWFKASVPLSRGPFLFTVQALLPKN